MFDSDRLSEIRKRREAATPGPWRMTTQGGVESVHYRGPGEDFTSVAATRTPGDWEFIAHAPADIDWLLAEVERLHSWDGLMALLDEHWPDDIFPTLPDREDRDPGARIVSLLRWVDRLRSKLGNVREEIERSKWRFDHEYGSHFVTDADDILAILDREETDRG